MEISDGDLKSIKTYFDESHWARFSDDEKQRFVNIKKNYENLLAICELKKSDYDRVYNTVPSLINMFLQKLPHQIKELHSNQPSCSTSSAPISIKREDCDLSGGPEFQIPISNEFDINTDDVKDESAIEKRGNIDFVAEVITIHIRDHGKPINTVDTTNQIYDYMDVSDKSVDQEMTGFTAEDNMTTSDYGKCINIAVIKNENNDNTDDSDKSVDQEKSITGFTAEDNMTASDYGKGINTAVIKNENNDNTIDVNDESAIENLGDIDFIMEDIMIPHDNGRHTSIVDITNQFNSIKDDGVKSSIKRKGKKGKKKFERKGKKEKVRKNVIVTENTTSKEHDKHINIADSTNQLHYIRDSSDKSVIEKISKTDFLMESIVTSNDSGNHINILSITNQIDNIDDVSHKSTTEKEDNMDFFVEEIIVPSDNGKYIINTADITNEIGDINNINDKCAIENIGIIDFILDDRIISSGRLQQIKNVDVKNRLEDIKDASVISAIEKKSKKLKKKAEKNAKKNPKKKAEKKGKKNSEKKIEKQGKKEKVRKKAVAEGKMISNDLHKHASIADRLKIKPKLKKVRHCGNTATHIGYFQKQIDAEEKNVDEKKIFKCSRCDYTSPQSCHITVHAKAVHEKIKPYECEECSYKAAQAAHLRRHIMAIHEKRKPFKCSKCDHRASEAGNLRMHMMGVHERKRPHKCPECDYKATFSFNLRRHINDVHKQIRPYLCQKCDHKSSDKRMLQIHVNAVHEGLKPYHCPECDYKASWPANLREHKKRMHGGKKNIQMSVMRLR